MDICDLKQRLNSDVESVCHTLLPQGRRVGAEWKVGSLQGDPGDSLNIHLSGDKAGLWCDFATGSAGDLFDLIGQVRREPLLSALKWAEGYLGIPPPVKPKLRAVWRPGERPPDVTRPKNEALDYLTQTRCLSGETIKTFRLGCVTRTVEIDGESVDTPVIVFPFILPDNSLAMTKYLALKRTAAGKKIIRTDSGARPTLFGWQALDPNARTVLCVEGEMNAMSWSQYGIPALATPRGAGKGAKHSWIDAEWENLSRFEVIYLNFDPDESGQEAIRELPERLGRHRVRIVNPLPFKDANECLQNGVPKETMLAALDTAQTCDPDQLRPVSDYLEQVERVFYPEPEDHQGWALPFDGAGTFRLRRGEMSIWTGYSYSGKTQLLNQIALTLVRTGERVMIASLEMQPKRLLERVVRQGTGDRLPTKEWIKKTFQYLAGRMWLFDQQGAIKADNLLEICEYSLRRYGARIFIIDSLMKLGLGFDDFNGQKLLVERLQTFALQKDVHIALVAHPRKADGQARENRPPSKMDVAGIGNITDMADTVMIMFRNARKEKAMWAHAQGIRQGNYLDLLHEPDGRLICDKERNGDGIVFEIPLWYHRDSMQFRDTEPAVINPIIPFGETNGHREAEVEIDF